MRPDRFAGGKHGSGVYHQIIGQIPPHRVYIEAFLGNGAVMLEKRPAERSFGIDVDGDVVGRWRGDEVPNLEIVPASAFDWLGSYKWVGDEFVYADPPYLGDVRSCHEAYYRCEMMDAGRHCQLLELLQSLPCKVAISGYWSELYASVLVDWRVVSFRARTRRATVTEYLWMNYDQPLLLHDPRYVGLTFRERYRIKRYSERMPDWLFRDPSCGDVGL